MSQIEFPYDAIAEGPEGLTEQLAALLEKARVTNFTGTYKILYLNGLKDQTGKIDRQRCQKSYIEIDVVEQKPRVVFYQDLNSRNASEQFINKIKLELGDVEFRQAYNETSVKARKQDASRSGVFPHSDVLTIDQAQSTIAKARENNAWLEAGKALEANAEQSNPPGFMRIISRTLSLFSHPKTKSSEVVSKKQTHNPPG